MQLHDAHVLVTGGSSGIGLATVDRLLDRGARVSVIALDDPDLETLRRRSDDRLHVAAADVGDRTQVSEAVADCTASFGPCDVLVTCAGVTRPGYFLDLDDTEFERQMRVNYFGTLWAIRAVAPSMVERRGGSIVAIASLAGLFGVFGYSAYGPTKYAVRGLVDVVRAELGPHGVHVGCVFPPDVDTPMLAGEEPLKPSELRALSGTVHPIPPGQVADAILRGIERRRAVIHPEWSAAAISRIAGTAPGLTRWVTGRLAARGADAGSRTGTVGGRHRA